MVLLLLICLLSSLDGVVDRSLKEMGPSDVLVCLVVVLLMTESCLIGSLSLNILFLFFVEESDLQKGVDFTLNREDVGQN
jgi:hypothetical protein